MNTQNITLKPALDADKSFLIDVLSGNYLDGEFDGGAGRKPDRYLWQESEDYRSGWSTGVKAYWDKQYAEIDK